MAVRTLMTARQTDVVLGCLLTVSVLSGVSSWLVANRWAEPILWVHAVAGLAIIVLSPLKIRGSVRTGLRRGRVSRYVSAAYGLLILAAVGLGLLHATGLWFGVGYWTSLWTHLLLGFTAVPLTVWHIWSRPHSPNRSRFPVTDLDRRSVLATSAAMTAGAGLVLLQETTGSMLGLSGSTRAGTGSHELASLRPEAMPVVSWINDRTPEVDASSWPLTIFGQSVSVADLDGATGQLNAVLDCTGGWFSEQQWHVIALSKLLDELVPTDDAGRLSARSIEVVSATGFRRSFAVADAAEIYLATGYGGIPLRSGHGAPVRVVAPGRRGPWWVKWVTHVELSNRPAWLQPPLPTT